MFFCVASASRPWQMQFSVPFRRGCRRRSSTRPRQSDRLRHKNALRSSRNQPRGLPLAGGRNQRPGGGPHFDHLHVEGRAQPEYWQAPGCVCLFKRRVSRSRAHSQNLARSLAAGYLFPEIGRRRNAYLEANPDARSRSSASASAPSDAGAAAHPQGSHRGRAKLGTKEGYSGYGAEQGQGPLRAKISENLYGGRVAPEEVFVSDGASATLDGFR